MESEIICICFDELTWLQATMWALSIIDQYLVAMIRFLMDLMLNIFEFWPVKVAGDYYYL